METETQLTVSQLSPSAFERAYEDWRRDGPHYDWWNSIYEMKIEDGKARGFEIKSISFSGFWSQGDGASWVGYILLPEFLDWQDKQEKPPLTMHQSNLIRAAVENDLCENSIKVDTRGNYCHEMTMYLTYGFGVDYNSPVEELDTGFFAGMSQEDFAELVRPHMDSVDEALLEAARDYARDIYKALEEEHEHLTSEESFREQAESNEWLFTEEGEMV